MRDRRNFTRRYRGCGFEPSSRLAVRSEVVFQDPADFDVTRYWPVQREQAPMDPVPLPTSEATYSELPERRSVLDLLGPQTTVPHNQEAEQE
jgi:hypothetical protein